VKNPRVFYGFRRLPGLDTYAHGGMVKLQRMRGRFPNNPDRYNILYLVSSCLPPCAREIIKKSKQKGIKLVWNQNGVYYKAWYGDGYEKENKKMGSLMHMADHVFYQSQFCKRSADKFLGTYNGSSEILYNAVDTNIFVPKKNVVPGNELMLLSAGSQNAFYRLETVLKTLFHVLKLGRKAKLIIAGEVSWGYGNREVVNSTRRLIRDLKLEEYVIFQSRFSQKEAPSIYQQAHILLHPQYKDSCPGVVIEAMACGLPVVYSNSGGVPELVGSAAGIGVQVEDSWDKDFPPSPEKMAESVLSVADDFDRYSEAARQRARDCFDLQPWLDRHQAIFMGLLT